MVGYLITYTRSTLEETYTKHLNNAPLKVRHQNRANKTIKVNLGFSDSDCDQVLRIYHQNICGLGSKTNDLLIFLYPNLPHILCLTEQHLRQFQLQLITIDNYVLGAEFSRQSFLKGGGVCIFIQKNIPFSIINVEKFCKDKELKACAVKLDFLSYKICVITVYRSPISNFRYFINELDDIIKKIYKTEVQLIICGDLNINYLTESKEKQELNNILSTYNLISVINFPTRIKNNSNTTIDNIELHVGNLNNNKLKDKSLSIRKINFNTTAEFTDKLSTELWQSIFEHNNEANKLFNSFLNIYLQIFYSCFPKISVNRSSSTNQWITKGIINSCKRKNDLFLLTRNNNDLQLKEHYKKYSKILSQLVRTAKILHHNNQIAQSKNTIKTTWNVIKNETGRNNTV